LCCLHYMPLLRGTSCARRPMPSRISATV
jgi:hypothetical protein